MRGRQTVPSHTFKRTTAALAVLTIALAGIAGPVSADAAGPTWSPFNGDLMAQKYSPLDQITAENVSQLEVAWRINTGDVSDGSDGKPATVWSGTPLFVNDTIYIGTPFYRVFALEPDTGQTKWVYDTKASLVATVQGELKNRGVAYWEAQPPAAGERPHRAAPRRRADVLEHDVRPSPVGGLFHGARPLWGGVVEHLVRAELAPESALGVAPRGGEDAAALGLRDLDPRRADAGRCAEDQHGLARPDLGPRHDHPPRGEEH